MTLHTLDRALYHVHVHIPGVNPVITVGGLMAAALWGLGRGAGEELKSFL